MKKSYTFQLFMTAMLTLLFLQAAVEQAFSQNNRSTGKRAVISNYSPPVINPPDDSEHQQNTYIETINPDQSGIAKTNTEINGSSLNSDAPLAPAVVYTVGSGGTYASLGAAFAALGGGISTPVDLQMISNTTETFPLSLPAIPGASATNYIRIYPTVAGISITSANTTGTLNLNAIDYLTIDGRVNATGTTASMTILNSTTGGYTVRFNGGATNNTINYCLIKGRNNATNEGVVFFTTGTPGNSNYTISNCEISYDNVPATAPRFLIYSAGTAGQNNNNNTVSSCLLHDYFQSGTGQTSAIFLSSNSSAWTITGNSIYNSTNRNSTADGCYIYDININSGDGYTITNNYIGGQSPNCGGSPYSFTGNYINRFYHIYFTNNVATTNASSIQGNTIANINFQSNSSNNTVPYAAMFFTRGTVNVGTSSGNTFGSGTGTGSITLSIRRMGNSVSENYLSMIRYTGAAGNFQNNTIGSVSLAHSASLNGGDVANLYLIHILPASPTAIINVTNNTIGSTTTASSIQSTGTGTQIYKQIKAISVTPTGTYKINIANNTIANMYLNNSRSNISGSTGPSSVLSGIECIVYNSSVDVTGNSVYNLTSDSRSKFTDASASVNGIAVDSLSTGTNLVSQNTVYNLKNTETGMYDVTANGILVEGNATVERNLVYNLSIATASRAATSGATGIQLDPKSGTVNCRNNIIRLGLDETGGNISNGHSQAGIWLVATNSTGTGNIYHNTSYVTGTNSLDCPIYTAPFFSETQCNRTINNNSFYNDRTSDATDKDQHFAMVLGTTGTINCNYNNYYRPGGDAYATFCRANSDGSYTQFFDLDDWQDATVHDDNSVINEPGFITEGTATPNLHMRTTAGTCSNKGTPIASVTTDFDGNARSATTPDIGADEYSDPTIIVWNGSNSTLWDNTANWNTPIVPKWADVVTIPSGQSRYPVISSSYGASSYDITIESGASITINPNASLDLRGSVTNSNGVDGIYIKSDATGTGSLIQRDNLVQGYIERFVSGSTNTALRRYHTVSIPLDESNDSYTGLFLNSYLFYFLEPDNNWIGMGAPTTTPISELRGYLIYYVFGNDTTYSFQGPMKSGTFYPNVSGTFSGAPDNNHGWNLIPNPYASAINWTARGGWSKTSIDNAVYVWKPGATYATGDYASYVAGVSTNGGSNYIPVGQSFFVHANSTTPAIRMRNSSRVHNTTAFLKNAEESPLRDVLKLKIENSEGATDELAVRFNEFATEQFDTEWDAYAMNSEEMVPNISTTSGMQKYSINSLPYQTGEKVIPVNLEYARSGDLVFTASGMENFNMMPPIYLEDKLLEKFIDLHTQPEYQFSYVTGQTNRFNLVFANVTGNSNNTPNNWLIYRSNDKVYLDIPDLKGKMAQVLIYDIAGRKLLQEQVFFSGIKHVQAPVISGVYIVKIAGEKTYTRKIVVD